MSVFRFYALSEEDRTQLRDEERRCVESLRVSKPLANKLASGAGIYTQLEAEEERLLQTFHEVTQAFEGYEHEGAFDSLASLAGLLPSDIGLLTGRVETLYREREPAQAQAETIAMLHQWLHREQPPQE
ncbi:MAG TPA: hypothetical protein VFV38_25520 [Ktedonobacteraceae bacterium]|nr:hypothetical protein [Ktedonobacteraceae bacterium]